MVLAPPQRGASDKTSFNFYYPTIRIIINHPFKTKFKDLHMKGKPGGTSLCPARDMRVRPTLGHADSCRYSLRNAGSSKSPSKVKQKFTNLNH